MKNFIEVTGKKNKTTVLLPTAWILEVYCGKDGSVFVTTGFDRHGRLHGYFVAESYEEIKNKLKECEVD